MGHEARGAVLVTGASSGIGRELALLAAAEGRAVVLVARGEEALREVSARVREAGGEPVVLPLDLARPGAAGEIAAALEGRELEVDVLVNNAGFATYGAFSGTDLVAELAEIQVNVTTVVDLTKRLLPPMLARRRGAVLNVASTAAFQPGPLMAVYYASKAFVLSFSQALAEELSGSGVTVTALCPGPTATAFQDRAGMQKSRLFKLASVMDAATVARAGWRGMLRGRRVVVPGVQNRLSTVAVRFAPSRLVTAVVRRIQDATK